MELATVISRAKREILRDIADGTVPASVENFSQLHDHVDANGYGGAFETPFDASDEFAAFWNRVQNDLDAWLRAGRPS